MKDLELTEFEKGYLTAWFHSIIYMTNDYEGVDDIVYNGETDWHGLAVKDKIYDIAISYDEEKDRLIGIVYRCYETDSGEYSTDTSVRWYIGGDE